MSVIVHNNEAVSCEVVDNESNEWTINEVNVTYEIINQSQSYPSEEVKICELKDNESNECTMNEVNITYDETKVGDEKSDIWTINAKEHSEKQILDIHASKDDVVAQDGVTAKVDKITGENAINPDVVSVKEMVVCSGVDKVQDKATEIANQNTADGPNITNKNTVDGPMVSNQVDVNEVVVWEVVDMISQINTDNEVVVCKVVDIKSAEVANSGPSSSNDNAS